MLTPTTFKLGLRPTQVPGGITILPAPPITPSGPVCDGKSMYAHGQGFVTGQRYEDDGEQFVAMASAGDLCAVGVTNTVALDGPTSTTGAVNVYARDLDTNLWSLLTTLTSADTDELGDAVDIADDGTIVAIESFTQNLHVWSTGDKKTWSEQVTPTNSGGDDLAGPKISRNGQVVVCAGAFFSQAYVFTRANNWAQTFVTAIDDSQFQYCAAEISGDGRTIVLVRVDFTNDYTFIDTLQSTDLVTWVLTSTVQLQSDRLDIGSDTFDIALGLSEDGRWLACFANDQWDPTNESALFLLRGSAGVYTQTAYFHTNVAGDFLQGGGLAVANDGKFLLAGIPFDDTGLGELWMIPCLAKYAGLNIINNVGVKVEIPVMQPAWGMAVAMDAAGTNFVHSNTDDGSTGYNGVDFFISCPEQITC